MLSKQDISVFLISQFTTNRGQVLYFNNLNGNKEDILNSWSETNDEYILQFNQYKDVKFTLEGIELFVRLNTGLISASNSFGTKLRPNFGSVIIDCKFEPQEVGILLDGLIGKTIYEDLDKAKPSGRLVSVLLGNLEKWNYDKSTQRFGIYFKSPSGRLSMSLEEISILIYISYSMNQINIFDSGIMVITNCGYRDPLTTTPNLTPKISTEESSPTKKCTCGALKCNPNATEFDHSSWCDLVKKD